MLDIIKLAKSIHAFLIEYSFNKRSLRVCSVFLFLGLIFILFSSPKFLIESTLIENRAGFSGQSLGGLSDIIQLSDEGGGEYYEKFTSSLYSVSTAERLWEMGWGNIIYANNDAKDQNKIRKPIGITSRLGSIFLGYPLRKYYSPLDLKSYISRNVVVRKFSRNSKKIIVTMITADKEFGIKFLNDVIIQGDYVVKEHELTTAQARTNALTKQLVKSKNSIVSNALSSLLNTQYYTLASLENDLPYSVYFIDYPNSEEKPISPNIPLVLFCLLLIGLVSSTTYSFFSKNKDKFILE
tara:strand:+ start:6871 stop:7758 length:888 start_codon:yes stop_codon:yes gene_type:complete